VCVCVWN